jgi:hypothetical protein
MDSDKLIKAIVGTNIPGLKLIYLGCPYSHPDPAVTKARMAVFASVTARYMRENIGFPVSPLLNHYLVDHHDLGKDWTFWQRYSRRLLGRCDELHIIELKGWEESEGLAAEIAFARELSMPVMKTPYLVSTYAEALAQHLAADYGLVPQVGTRALEQAHYDVPLARKILEARGAAAPEEVLTAGHSGE